MISPLPCTMLKFIQRIEGLKESCGAKIRNASLRLSVGILGLLVLLPQLALAAEERPNIVLVMVDDMGFSDLGCYGSEIKTPNIDALASGGVRFSQFYNNSRCCPTRATLMTGLQPHQVGIGHMTHAPREHKNGPPAYQGYLNNQCSTLAEVLRGVGYNTLMSGKWHLGYNSQEQWPIQRGFDKYYGCISGATNYFNPRQPRGITFGNTIDKELKSTTDRRYYTTDAFTDNAIRFVQEEATEKTNPFFLYLAYTAPHWPIQAHDEDLAKYRGKYRVGWDKLRQERYQKQIEIGLIDPEWPLSPRDEVVPAWDTLRDPKQNDMDLRMSLYAAMVDRMDQNVGKLVKCLKEQGKFDNTLILFLSDNGACAEGGVLGRGNVLNVKKRNASGDVSYGKAWANLSSTPYRLYKHFTHEGGSCSPFFMHWPDRIKTQPDWYRQPAQLIDVMPTLLEVANATYPATVEDQTIPPLEGISLVPAFSSKALTRENPIFVEHENNASVRDGKWKLVGRNVARNKGVHPKSWELYDMEKDGTELNNLADTHTDIVQDLASQWNAWADRVKVYPKE